MLFSRTFQVLQKITKFSRSFKDFQGRVATLYHSYGGVILLTDADGASSMCIPDLIQMLLKPLGTARE